MRPPHCAALLVAGLLLVCASSGAAITNPTPQRAFVASTGSDLNNCGLAAPCRTLNAALLQVNPGGEIVVLDSGGFGSIANGALADITQSVTITVPSGIYGGLSAPAGVNAININAPGGNVTLRNLKLSAQTFSGNNVGVSVLSAAQVTIENCTISNFAGSGIAVSSGLTSSVLVDGSTLEQNQTGISLLPSSQPALLTVNNTLFQSETNVGAGTVGLLIGNPSVVSVRLSRFISLGTGVQDAGSNPGLGTSILVQDSVFAGSSSSAVQLGTGAASANTTSVLSGNVITGTRNSGGTASGIKVSNSTTLWLSGNNINDNDTGISASGSAYVINTDGTNDILLNLPGGNVSGTLTTATGQ